jgi:hypothetical protein
MELVPHKLLPGFNPCYYGLVVLALTSLSPYECPRFNPCYYGLVILVCPGRLAQRRRSIVSILVIMDWSSRLCYSAKTFWHTFANSNILWWLIHQNKDWNGVEYKDCEGEDRSQNKNWNHKEDFGRVAILQVPLCGQICQMTNPS